MSPDESQGGDEAATGTQPHDAAEVFFLAELRRCGLPDPQAAECVAAAAWVFAKMPEAAVRRFTRNTSRIEFFPDAPELTDRLAAESAAARKVRDAGHLVQGVYDCGNGRLFLDGPRPGDTLAQHYSHEFWHPVDGIGWELSESPSWRAAWAEEVLAPHVRDSISAQARWNPHEALAAFGSMLIGGNRAPNLIRTHWPGCLRFFEENGLWKT